MSVFMPAAPPAAARAAGVYTTRTSMSAAESPAGRDGASARGETTGIGASSFGKAAWSSSRTMCDHTVDRRYFVREGRRARHLNGRRQHTGLRRHEDEAVRKPVEMSRERHRAGSRGIAAREVDREISVGKQVETQAPRRAERQTRDTRELVLTESDEAPARGGRRQSAHRPRSGRVERFIEERRRRLRADHSKSRHRRRQGKSGDESTPQS